jgi:ankyrin repeat protein
MVKSLKMDEMTQNNHSTALAPDPKRLLAQQAVGQLCAQWEASAIPQSSVLPVVTAQVVETRPDDYDATDLIQVCHYGDLDALQELIAQGIDLHSDGEAALRRAANKGQTAIVTVLLAHDADFHVDNDIALRLASNHGHIETVRLLLDRGATIHAKNDWALQGAAENGHTETVLLLLDHNANIHAAENRSLWRAAQNGHIETARLLLDRGADIHAKNDVAVQLSAQNGHTEIVRLLLDRGADIHTDNDWALEWAAGQRHSATVALLIERGAPIDKLTPAQRNIHDLYLEMILDRRKQAVQAKPTLTEIFQAKTWAGHIPEMLALWTQVPDPLKTEIDFQHALSDAKSQTLKQLNKRKVTFIK